MILAELEVFHSRPFSPTRRVALGYRRLPTEPAPGFGPLLLGAIVAAHVEQLDGDLVADLHRLTVELEQGRRIPQPRLRHRLQTDRVGLARSYHRLVGGGDQLLSFDFDNHGSAPQQVLAAVYAGGQLPADHLYLTMEIIRIAMHWRGPIGPALVTHLTGRDGAASWSSSAYVDPYRWALDVLGFEPPVATAATAAVADTATASTSRGADGDRSNRNGSANGQGTGPDGGPSRAAVQRRFRDLLRSAHPDHGAQAEGAAQRIADLTEARRILLRP